MISGYQDPAKQAIFEEEIQSLLQTNAQEVFLDTNTRFLLRNVSGYKEDLSVLKIYLYIYLKMESVDSIQATHLQERWTM